MTIDTSIGIAIRYQTNQGEGFVYGGFVGGMIAAASIMFGAPGWIALFALGGFALAFYHAPMVRKGDPPVAMIPDGLAIAGLGILPWRDIKSLDIRENWVRTLPNPELVIETTGDLKAVLVPSRSNSPMRQFQIRAAKKQNSHHLTIPLQALNQEAEHIYDAAQAYWSAHR